MKYSQREFKEFWSSHWISRDENLENVALQDPKEGKS